MQSEWETITLREAGVILIDCDHKTPKAQETGLPYIGIPQLKEGQIITDTARLISREDFKYWRRKANPTTHDIILSRRCNPGVTAYVPEGLEIALGQNLVLLRSDGKLLYPPFLRWVVRGSDWWKQVSKFLNVGAVFESLKCAHIPNFEIKLPPLETQKKIANILSKLDDKIELNRKVNQTLEEMAQTLFKSWFVDFEPVHTLANRADDTIEKAASELGISKEVLELFPSKFEDSELGTIPKGWKIKRLEEFGNIITGKTPSTKKSENFDGKYPFITIPDMHSHLYIDSSMRTISEIGNKVQPKKLIPKDSLIVSCIATVGLVGINTKNSHTNQQINSIVCEKKYLYYLYNLIKGMKSKLEMFGSAGTTTLNVNKSTFENIEVIKPNDVILEKFLLIIESSYKQILKNIEEIKTLEKTRDTLLPKLLSGEVKL